MVMQETVPETKGIWYYGTSGCGKSSIARAKYPNSYSKLANKWFDGYRQEKTIILDDLDKSHDKLGYHLKIWADHYGC